MKPKSEDRRRILLSIYQDRDLTETEEAELTAIEAKIDAEIAPMIQQNIQALDALLKQVRANK